MSYMLRRALFVLTIASICHAQSAPSDSAKRSAPPPIEDNSFLVEEAYNQERGVVQHISTFQRSRDGGWMYGFTQEWPAPSLTHQLSYTVPMLGGSGAGTGAGDLKLNYRYQAMGGEGRRVWISPRLTAVLPTGDAGQGRGSGGAGVEAMLPVSIEHGAIVTHWDVGGSLTRARAANGQTKLTRGANLAASTIWLAAPTLNFIEHSFR